MSSIDLLRVKFTTIFIASLPFPLLFDFSFFIPEPLNGLFVSSGFDVLLVRKISKWKAS